MKMKTNMYVASVISKEPAVFKTFIQIDVVNMLNVLVFFWVIFFDIVTETNKHSRTICRCQMI